MSLDVELDSVRVPLGLGFDEQRRSMNISQKGTLDLLILVPALYEK